MRCHIRHFSLAQTPSYYALSYCWGDPTFTIPILCNGAAFEVTRNLLSALKQLREEGQHSWIWADAICINQLDEEEKSGQIALVRDIYKMASWTMIWLEDSTKETSVAISMVYRLVGACRKYNSKGDTRILTQMDES